MNLVIWSVPWLRWPATSRGVMASIVGLAAWLITLVATLLGWLEAFEWTVYDAAIRATSGYRHLDDSRADPEIVIVTIDETALRLFAKLDPHSNVGRGMPWPWARGYHGCLIDFCREGRAAAVVFDVLLTRTRDDTTAEKLVESLLAARQAGMPVVLGTQFSEYDSYDETPEALLAALAVPVERDATAPVRNLPGAAAPQREFLEAAGGVGNVNVGPERDGVVRRISPLVSRGGKCYLSLGLVPVWLLDGRPPVRLWGSTLYLGERAIPLDEDGRVAIRYNGPPWRAGSPSTATEGRDGSPTGTYRTYSAYAPIERQLRRDIDDDPAGAAAMPLQPEALTGKIVFVGATARGLLDTKASPFSEVHPGVEIHANAADNLRAGRFVNRRWSVWGLAAVVWLALALAAALAGAMLPVAWGLAAVMALGTALLAAGIYALAAHDISWRMLSPTAAISLGYLGGLAGGLTLETRRRAWVQGAFSQFLSAEVLNVLMAHPERLALGGERQTVTVFFSDVAGFTALSETVTPEQLVEQLNTYLTRMSDRLLERGAYIDKFIGDAIMAFWGAPTPVADHAQRACLAALDCLAEMRALAAEAAAAGLPPLACRIGINTGPVICGMMGSRRKLNYTVMGDTVNTASRLEGANKAFGSLVLISEETVIAAGGPTPGPQGSLCAGPVVLREIDMVRVKGRQQPVRLYEAVATVEGLSPTLAACLAAYNQGLAAYRNRQWTVALSHFETAALHDHPGGHNPSREYIARCRHYADNPPADDWDGIYQMTTK